MKAFTKVESIVCPLLRANVDTDQIIPARFLQKPRGAGLGEYLFHDLRTDPGFVLHRFPNAQILLAGENFGCGSSRENAVWALADFGFRVVIAPSFGDIFFNNCLKNGLLPVRLEVGQVSDLPAEVDLETQTVRFGEETLHFDIDPFARHCMLNGVDELGYTLSRLGEIEAFERTYSQP